MDAPDIPDGFPAPNVGMLVSLFLTVADVDRAVAFYVDVLGGSAIRARDPAIVQLANSWLIMNPGGGPTPDKPDVSMAPPDDPGRTSCFLNLRVADIARSYAEWSARGAVFLTPPILKQGEIRCYIRDPDGYLIEVGQTTQVNAGDGTA